MPIRFFSNHSSDENIHYSASVTNVNHGGNIEIFLLAPDKVSNRKALSQCASCEMYMPDATPFDIAACTGIEQLDCQRSATLRIASINEFRGDLSTYLSTIYCYLAQMICQNKKTSEGIYKVIERGLRGKER